MFGCNRETLDSERFKILWSSQLARSRIDHRRELEALAKSLGWEEDVIIRFFGWYEADDKIYLAMESFQLADLEQYTSTGKIPEAETKSRLTRASLLRCI